VLRAATRQGTAFQFVWYTVTVLHVNGKHAIQQQQACRCLHLGVSEAPVWIPITHLSPLCEVPDAFHVAATPLYQHQDAAEVVFQLQSDRMSKRCGVASAPRTADKRVYLL
jgi:hypothetical protein